MQKTKTNLIFIIFLTFFYSFSSLVPWNVVLAGKLSYSKSIRANIIDRFKREQFNNVFLKNNAVLSEDLNFFDTQSKIDTYESIRRSNDEKKRDLIIQKNVLENRILSLEETIKLLDEDIAATQKEILALSRKIISTQETIEAIKAEIARINREIAESKKVLLEYIVHIYKKQNLISAGDSIDGLKTILLSSDDLGEVLNDIHFLNILESTGQMLLERYRRLVKELFVKKLDLEKEHAKLRKIRKEELLKRKLQLEKREFRRKILEFTKGKQELFEEFIKSRIDFDRKIKIKILQNKVKLIKQKEELLSKYNCKYIDVNALNNAPENIELDEESFSGNTTDNNCLTLNRVLLAESQLRPLKDISNPLSWPVDPKNGLSAYFQDPSYQDEIGSSHEAIDIKVPQGTDIKAPADGYVIYLKEPVDEGYAYIALKHAGGFVTIYGHVSEVFVKKYDVVKAGEVFARSGGEFGTNGAGIMTTGPHLHFEVWKDRQVLDPLMYLDLTKIPYDRIPNETKYLNKYSSDYEEKYGYEYGGEVDIFDLIRGFEGFRENAYQDSAGVWTIGYGFTTVRGEPVKEGDFITREEAEIELARKIRHYTNFKSFVKVPLTKEQEAALISFEYNLGRNIWTKPTDEGGAMPIIDMINVGDLVGAAKYMMKFDSAGGKDLRGLANRRLKEANLLLRGTGIDAKDLDSIDLSSYSFQ